MGIMLSRRRMVAGLGVSLVMPAALVTPAAAQGTQAATRIDINIAAKDFSFDLPARVPAGLVQVTMQNHGADLHHTQIGRLNDGVTFDQFHAALGKDLNAAFPLISFQGGPGVILPGASQAVMLNLTRSGTYVAVCFIAGDDGIPHFMKGMIVPFEVTGPETPLQELKSHQTIKMMDFAYTMPDKVPAGRQVWKIINDGPQPHELILLMLAPGVTADQILAMFASEMGSGEATPATGMDMGTPAAATPTAATPVAATPAASPVAEAMPFMPAGGMQALDAGLAGWLILDLAPGNYLAACDIPDPRSGRPHFELGMYKAFTVAGFLPHCATCARRP